MKAIVKHHAGVGAQLQNVEKPTIGATDVLIKIKQTAICGTDLHIYKWDQWAQKTIPVPLTFGHEFSGQIVEIGSAVKGLTTGSRVSGEGHITCEHCRNCRAGKRHLCKSTLGVGVNHPGAFAEYLVLPADNVCLLPDDISDDLGCILDPLGNAVHTALAFDMIGEDVLITGAGPIGIMAVAICKHIGARHVVITDVNPQRLEMAKAMGADITLDVRTESLQDAMSALKMKEGFDVILEMSGNAVAINDMLDYANNGAKLSLLGVPAESVTIDWSKVIFKGLSLQGIYGREMFETWYKMIAMLQAGLNVSPVITHHFKADDFEAAFETALSGKAGKVIMIWE